MPQSSITNFFKKVQSKKSNVDGNNDSNSNENLPMNKQEGKNESEPVSGDKRKSYDDGGGGDSGSKKLKVEEKKSIGEMSRLYPGALDAHIGPSWYSALSPEFRKPYFKKLSDFLEQGRASGAVIFPQPQNVWSWTHHFDITDTKVVILGQDPYHGPNQAHGLCFSVQRGVPAPPSLVNIFKELADDIPGFQRPDHGELTGWSKQGVLLLNACLTVQQAKPNSHKDQGWEKITDAVIKYISDNCVGVVFLLWGAFAHKKAAFVDAKRHHLLKTVHPSPLSAHRGFLGCKHFSKCNALLEKQAKSAIDWGKWE